MPIEMVVGYAPGRFIIEPDERCEVIARVVKRVGVNPAGQRVTVEFLVHRLILTPTIVRNRWTFDPEHVEVVPLSEHSLKQDVAPMVNRTLA